MCTRRMRCSRRCAAATGRFKPYVDGARQILWQEFQQRKLIDDQFAQTLENLDPERHHAFAYLGRSRPHDQPGADDPVWAAQAGIWRLFDAGLIDDSSATVALLAIHVGVQRRSTDQACTRDEA
jgi:hypothetical protein